MAFFSWLDFCDDLIEKSHPVISESLVNAIEVGFFQAKFEVCLWQEDKSNLHQLRLGLLSQIWAHLRSEGLAKAFTRWLFTDTDLPDQREPLTSTNSRSDH